MSLAESNPSSRLEAAIAAIEAKRDEHQGFIDSGHSSDNSIFYAWVEACNFALAALGVKS